MIRILIVDDSETVRQMLVHELDRQTDMHVVGIAANGVEAIRQAQKLKPDIITMDFKMPNMDGLKATQEIMCTCPCPVIIVSQYRSPDDKNNIFEALQAGAVAVANKPAGPKHPEYESSISTLLKTIRMMSEIKVVTRRRINEATPVDRNVSLKKYGVSCPPPCRDNCAVIKHECKRVVIGASTGGPVVLREIFERLSSPYPLPILVVQHIATGFLPGMVEWLASSTGHLVEIAEHGVIPEAGHIYFAPDNLHMGIDRSGKITLSDAPKLGNLRPAVSHLFQTVAAYNGAKTIGVLLTGMGADGARELKLLKDAGAATVIQNRESCVVFGMPGEALKLNAARHILAPPQIAEFLSHAVQRPNEPAK